MMREYQQIGAAVVLPNGNNETGASPSIGYSWEYAPTPAGIGASGHNRLVSMQYPKVTGVLQTRQVNLNYDSAGLGLDSALSRLSSFSTTLGNTVSNVASFTYAGTSRRASMNLAAGKITQNWRTPDADGLGIPAGLNGLDRFGRPRDLHYRNAPVSPATPSTLFRAEYSYDLSGNRTGAKITQAPVGVNTNANKRSQVNTYDDLDRLSGTFTGALSYDGSNNPLVVTPIRSDVWSIDLLGNWVGIATQPTGH